MASENQERTAGATPVRVLIVDDHKTILWGLVKLIESERPLLEVVGTASNGQEALAAAERERPDVVLLDLELGGESGLDLLPRLLGGGGGGPLVIILTGSADESLHDRAVRLGARGIVLKNEPAENILRAIEKVRRGEMWLDRATSARMFAEFSGRGPARTDAADGDGDGFAQLTQREREIVALVAQGLKTEQIAERLFISEKTVRNNLTIIFDKVSVKSRLELVLLAQRHGLVKL